MVGASNKINSEISGVLHHEVMKIILRAMMPQVKEEDFGNEKSGRTLVKF